MRGSPIARGEESFTLDVKGVGYEVFCSKLTLENVSEQKELSIFVYTHVRQDIIQLFGFSSMLEKKLFLSLNKVNGVGPKMAISILSGAPTNRIVEMIESSNVKGLTQLPKVGNKKAEQIILSLKGQLVVDRVIEANLTGHSEIVSALVHLGFRISDVEAVANKMPGNIGVQEGVRLGLAALTNPV